MVGRMLRRDRSSLFVIGTAMVDQWLTKAGKMSDGRFRGDECTLKEQSLKHILQLIYWIKLEIDFWFFDLLPYSLWQLTDKEAFVRKWIELSVSHFLNSGFITGIYEIPLDSWVLSKFDKNICPGLACFSWHWTIFGRDNIRFLRCVRSEFEICPVLLSR
jgi:hypothetical protein